MGLRFEARITNKVCATQDCASRAAPQAGERAFRGRIRQEYDQPDCRAGCEPGVVDPGKQRGTGPALDLQSKAASVGGHSLRKLYGPRPATVIVSSSTQLAGGGPPCLRRNSSWCWKHSGALFRMEALGWLAPRRMSRSRCHHGSSAEAASVGGLFRFRVFDPLSFTKAAVRRPH